MSIESDRVATFGRLEDGLLDASPWYLWGPYLSDRQWGTVREDYSPGGTAWEYVSHDDARSRAYRWGEDGIAGFSDIEQRLCLSLALWNGRDPILKERMFGLTGNQGNHGEDVKEYWFHVDALPSHAWNRLRYHYPQRAYPYEDLVAENARRGKLDPEYELLDTGAFDDGYWVVEVDYAKAGPDDVLMTVRATNAGGEPAELHLLPTVWFRNTWSWDVGAAKPELRVTDAGTVAIDHPTFGPLELIAGPGPDGDVPPWLCCENETNERRLFGVDGTTPYPKDGINDHVVSGAPTVNPAGTGTKAAAWYRVTVAAAETAEIRLRLRPAGGEPSVSVIGADFDEVVSQRRAEADEFYAELTPAACPPEEAHVLRRAFAGMLWCKQLYAYDVARWLDGDPTQPRPPDSRLGGRNSRWRSFDAFDIMSMPDIWEYPWFAAWDMAFHCVALAHVDPAFAKYQLVLLCREWFQAPNGALAAYEWAFDDVNPPVQAWAALLVFAIDGAEDVDFLERVFDKLLVNFTWWVNREDADGSNLFEGGFLGLDNIGPLDRSHLPVDGRLEQSDATAWMAFYALDLAAIAAVLRGRGRPTQDLVLKFLEHFAQIRDAMNGRGLWDEEDGFYYDQLITPGGEVVPVRVRSMVGVLPLLACVTLDDTMIQRGEAVRKRFARLLAGRTADAQALADSGALRGEGDDRRLLLGVVGADHVLQVLRRVFDEEEFLSPYGLRAVSRYHLEHPYELDVEGIRATIDYEPAESTTSMFGGNSNWRGPIWFPVNHLVISALDRYGAFYGDDAVIEYPTGSGRMCTFREVADDLRDRLIALFVPDASGRRPCFGWVERFRNDPQWQDQLLFNEYFHGDVGAGLGASHQTGWTGVIADIILRRRGPALASLSELVGTTVEPPGPATRAEESPTVKKAATKAKGRRPAAGGGS